MGLRGEKVSGTFLSSMFAVFFLSAGSEFSAAVFGAFALGLGLELWADRINSAFENGENRRNIQLPCGNIYGNDANFHRLA